MGGKRKKAAGCFLACLPLAALTGILGEGGSWAAPSPTQTPIQGKIFFIGMDSLRSRAVPADRPLDCGCQATLTTLWADTSGRAGSFSRAYSLGPEVLAELRRDLGDHALAALRLAIDQLKGPPSTGGGEQPVPAPEDPCLQLLEDQLPYRVQPWVVLSLAVEVNMARLAARFFRRTQTRLRITSSFRTPESQAEAMYNKLIIGRNLLRLYRHQRQARELIRTYRVARKAGADAATILGLMAHVLREQMRRGEYLSAHLRAGAVDVRSRGMSRRDRRIFRNMVERSCRFRLFKEEHHPPHFHLEAGPPERRRRRGRRRPCRD